MSAFAKILNRLAIRLAKWTDSSPVQVIENPNEDNKPIEIVSEPKQEIETTDRDVRKSKEKKTKKKESRNVTALSIDPRDIMESMGIPFLALSKNRKAPIVYESSDGTTKVRISCHSEHYIASIYDWDIIQCIAGKIQEVINSKKDTPPRTLIIPRHKLLKELHKHDGRTNQKKVEASLNRLQTTLIDTTIRNEDYRYRSGFSFLDGWRYTERKDVKEFKITLSEWLYDGVCRDGALLKVHQEYFDLTSGLQKILYRIARKHVGVQNTSWDFSIEELHEKSGSEQELKKFKYDLKKAISDQKIPGYKFEWIEENGKITIRIINLRKYGKEALMQPVFPAFDGSGVDR